MKARLPKGYSNGGMGSMQQIAKKAQKMQEEMQKATSELEEKNYVATSGGGAVEVVANGKMEIKSLKILPEVIDKDDSEMLADLIMAAVNEALRLAENEKDEVMEGLTGGLNIPGLF